MNRRRRSMRAGPDLNTGKLLDVLTFPLRLVRNFTSRLASAVPMSQEREDRDRRREDLIEYMIACPGVTPRERTRERSQHFRQAWVPLVTGKPCRQRRLSVPSQINDIESFLSVSGTLNTVEYILYCISACPAR